MSDDSDAERGEARGWSDGDPSRLPDAVDGDRAALWVVTLVLLAALAYVAWRYVGTVVLGLFVYYVTRPVFKRIHAGLGSRTLAVVVSLVTVAMPVLILVAWTVAIALQGLSELLESATRAEVERLVRPYVDLSSVLRDAEETVRTVLADPTQVGDLEVGPLASGVAEALLSSLGVLVTAAIHGFVVLIIAFYLLRDDYRIARWARETFVDGVVESYLRAVDRDLKNVYFGNILNALLTGILASVTYVLLNAVAPPVVQIPRAALLGLLVGAASLVPVIGIKIVWVPVAAYLAGRALLLAPGSVWFPVVFGLVSVVVVDYIPDQLLRPYVSGRTLHVGAVMLAYTLGPLLFGWYGIFLGPLLLVVVFEFARIVLPWLVDPDASPPAVAGEPGRQPSGKPVETPDDSPGDSQPDVSGNGGSTAVDGDP